MSWNICFQRDQQRMFVPTEEKIDKLPQMLKLTPIVLNTGISRRFLLLQSLEKTLHFANQNHFNESLSKMKSFILISLYFLVACLCSPVVSDDWGYGPSDGDWDDIQGADCDGKYQSPIDLIDVCDDKDNLVTVNSSLKVKLHNYDKPIKAKDVLFKNNGHTAQVKIKGSDDVVDNMPSISGSAVGKNSKFQLQQIHFHWNRNGSHAGSEHSLYGHKKAFEMHLVHFNTKYGDFEDAEDHPDGSVVISVLFDYFDCSELSNHKNCDENTPENKALASITKKLRDINDADEVASLDDDLDLRGLLPSNTDTFYWYKGSLTTPPCSEHLTWIVFPDVQNISKIQLDSFEHNFRNEDGKILGTTNRDLQPLNNRKLVITSDDHCKHDDDKDGSATSSENEKKENSSDEKSNSRKKDDKKDCKQDDKNRKSEKKDGLLNNLLSWRKRDIKKSLQSLKHH